MGSANESIGYPGPIWTLFSLTWTIASIHECTISSVPTLRACCLCSKSTYLHFLD